MHSGEKSNKCNQCDFASAYASALRAHFKKHSEEKPNKCNPCDYVTSHALFEDTFEDAHRRKVKQMQPV